MNQPTLDPEFATALRSELISTVTEPTAVMNNTTRNLMGAAALVLAAAVAVPIGLSIGGIRPDERGPAPVMTPTSGVSHNSGMSRAHVYSSLKELAGGSSLVVKATASASREETLGGLPTVVTSLEVAACFLVGGVVGTEPVSPQQATTGPAPCNAGDTVKVRTFDGDLIEFEEGETYLLFLTSTGLAQDPSNLYYVTGTGAYKQVANSTYERLVIDVLDDIPLQLQDGDVA